MLLQGISHAIKSVFINSNFKIFAGGKPPDPQIKLASLVPGPPIRNPGYAPDSELYTTPDPNDNDQLEDLDTNFRSC